MVDGEIGNRNRLESSWREEIGNTSPTPSIFTTQQLGLGITKAFATHIKNSDKKSSVTAAMESTEIEAQDSCSVGSNQ